MSFSIWLNFLLYIFIMCLNWHFRTLGSIRCKAADYKKACQEWTKKTKLSAKEFTNCVKNPLITGSDDQKVIDVFPVMELHVYTGNFNSLYDLGESILIENESTFHMRIWAEYLTLERPGLHGGQFTGNQCTKLLNNLEKLEELSSSQDVQNDKFANLILCFRALKVNLWNH